VHESVKVGLTGRLQPIGNRLSANPGRRADSARRSSTAPFDLEQIDGSDDGPASYSLAIGAIE
jgi:hypothetical protein